MSDDDAPEPHNPEADDAEPSPDDASSRKSLRGKKQRAVRDRKESEAFWRGVFADPVGRREMWRILAEGHAFSERFACGPTGFPQTEATWFHAGEQALALRLYHSWAALDRAGVFLMQDEHDPRFAKPAKGQ